MSIEAVRTRQMWERLVIDAAAAGLTPPVAAKNFKPKFPDIPVRDDYRRPADTEFWIEFPTNFNCPGKPSLIKKRLKWWADALGCSDTERLRRVLQYIEGGADIGCRGAARLPSSSNNAASAFEFGPQVTDAIAEWVQKGYAYGPVDAAAVPWEAKISDHELHGGVVGGAE
jgi:hypothetical protein